MTFVIGFIVGSSVFIFVGWFGREIIEFTRTLSKRMKKEDKPGVTKSYISPKPYMSQNSIIIPKTPEELRTEAYEQAKRGSL